MVWGRGGRAAAYYAIRPWFDYETRGGPRRDNSHHTRVPPRGAGKWQSWCQNSDTNTWGAASSHDQRTLDARRRATFGMASLGRRGPPFPLGAAECRGTRTGTRRRRRPLP